MLCTLAYCAAQRGLADIWQRAKLQQLSAHFIAETSRDRLKLRPSGLLQGNILCNRATEQPGYSVECTVSTRIACNHHCTHHIGTAMRRRDYPLDAHQMSEHPLLCAHCCSDRTGVVGWMTIFRIFWVLETRALCRQCYVVQR